VHLLRLAAASLAALLIAFPAAAQQKPKANPPYEPQVGQAGKDVIWVPTPDEVVDRMLRMAQVTANDYVIDLGAGDGKIAIAAAKSFGARSMGIEYNPEMAKHAQGNVEKAGVTGRARLSATLWKAGDQVDVHLATLGPERSQGNTLFLGLHVAGVARKARFQSAEGADVEIRLNPSGYSVSTILPAFAGYAVLSLQP